MKPTAENHSLFAQEKKDKQGQEVLTTVKTALVETKQVRGKNIGLGKVSFENLEIAMKKTQNSEVGFPTFGSFLPEALNSSNENGLDIMDKSEDLSFAN